MWACLLSRCLFLLPWRDAADSRARAVSDDGGDAVAAMQADAGQRVRQDGRRQQRVHGAARQVGRSHFWRLHWTMLTAGEASSRLHDFGFRGCTSVEQSVIGGAAHLVCTVHWPAVARRRVAHAAQLNFDGTDTMSAAYYVQYHLNNGQAVATSIPASEHSVMTAWSSERSAMLHMIDKFGSGVFACVMDSYDYANALERVLPSVARAQVEKGGFLVLRPDSGDQVEVVLAALDAAERLFGSTTNTKGYRVPNSVGVIQGDGVTYASLNAILEAIEKRGFSAQSVAFGMGGGLLQKVNRDTMSFATKLSHIEYASGEKRDVMKIPKVQR